MTINVRHHAVAAAAHLLLLLIACCDSRSVAAVTVTPAATQAPPLAAPVQSGAEFNPYTGYFVLGETPSGFAAIKYLEFKRSEETGGSARPEGFIVTDLSDPERGLIGLTKIVIRGRKLAFRTDRQQGVVYSFEGRFLRGGDLKRFSRQKIAVIEGMASKYERGRKVAAGRMRFYCVADAG